MFCRPKTDNRNYQEIDRDVDYRVITIKDRSWTEDFELENGNYRCICYKCRNQFEGHKRRVVCKICDGKDNK